MCNTVLLHSLPAQIVVSAKTRETCNICMLLTPFLLQYLSIVYRARCGPQGFPLDPTCLSRVEADALPR